MHGVTGTPASSSTSHLPDNLPILRAEHSLSNQELFVEGLDSLRAVFPELNCDVYEKLDLPVRGRRVSTARRAIAGESARVESHFLKGDSNGTHREIVSKISSQSRRSVAQDLANHHLLAFASKLGLSSKTKSHGQRYIIPFLGARNFKNHIHHYMPKGESAFDYVQNEWFPSAKGFQESQIKASFPTAEWNWEKRVAQWSAELIAALEYIHDLGFSHNDVKLENVILLDGHAYLIDFDSMTQLGTVTKNDMMTKHYCSRETKSGKYCPKKNDIYALGICIFMMLFAHQPERSEFHDLTSGSYSQKTEGRKGCLVNYVKKLGRKCLVSEPAFDFLKCVLRPEGERSSLSELAKHPWIVENSSLTTTVLGTGKSDEANIMETIANSEDTFGLNNNFPSELRQGVDLALDGSRIALQNLLLNFRQKPCTQLIPFLDKNHPELSRSLRIEYYYQHLSEIYNHFCNVPAQHTHLIE
jgi:serine/threonine protein kinase